MIRAAIVTISGLIALLLCIASVVGIFRPVYLPYVSDTRFAAIYFSHSECGVIVDRHASGEGAGIASDVYRIWHPTQYRHGWSFTWRQKQSWEFKGWAYPFVRTWLSAQTWPLVFLFGAHPAVVFVRWWARRRRDKKGACVDCGYDLTGNVSGTCPECGNEI